MARLAIIIPLPDGADASALRGPANAAIDYTPSAEERQSWAGQYLTMAEALGEVLEGVGIALDEDDVFMIDVLP